MALHSLFPACINGEAPGPDYSSWFGTGEDGDLTVSTDVALPVALDSGQIVKQYNNLTITSTGVLHPANRCNGMILLVKGDLTVDGTIHVDKCAPLLNDNEELAAQEEHVALCGVTAGGKGGDGGTSGSYDERDCQRGQPGTGGAGFQFGGGLGAGSGGVATGGQSGWAAYDGGSGDPRPPAGTVVPIEAAVGADSQYGAGGFARASSRGGSGYGGYGPGGSGGAGEFTSINGKYWKQNGQTGDAFGGGLLVIFVAGKVRLNSTAKISAAAGNGANGIKVTNGGDTGGGGGGGGGIVCIVHTGDIVNGASVTAPGGSGGAAGGGNSTAGSDGSSGTVLITNISDLLGEGEWEPEWVTCSFTYSSMGKFQNLALMENENGTPVVKTYTTDTAPASGTNVQVLKGSVVAIMPGPATIIDDPPYLFGVLHSVEVYVANADFSIGG